MPRTQMSVFRNHGDSGGDEKRTMERNLFSRITSVVRKRDWRTSVSLSTIAGFVPSAATAQEVVEFPMGLSLSTGDVASFTLVFGAVSAAMISAIWMIRERTKTYNENNELKSSLSDANASLARYEALVVDRDRRIVVWDGAGVVPEVLGQLPPETGAPIQDSEFLAFGRWLTPASAAALEHELDRLRAEAQRFDLTLETGRGAIIEAQGRVAGGRAFVRFVALNNLRSDMANLKAERDRLVGALETLQNMFDVIDLPVWTRDPDGKITWVNDAYCEAVEAEGKGPAIDAQLELLGTQARAKIRAAIQNSHYAGKVSTVVRGDRVFFDVTEAASPFGTAGMGHDISDIERVREELARTLKSHSETLDHLQTPVAIFDREQQLQFYNQAFQRLWDLETHYLDRKPYNDDFLERLRTDGKLPEPHVWREWKDNVLSVYRSVEAQPHLWHLPDGQTLNVFANAHPQGGVTWIFENLTEKVSLETRYNTLVQVQGETIDHMSEGVCVIGADGRISLSNPAFRALWGISEDQVKAGTHIRDIEEACRPAYDKDDGWKLFAAVITSFDDTRETMEGRLDLKSGLILDYALVPLPNAQTMLTFDNLTDSIRVERALKEKNDALSRADALKNDFVQHVSYELRSPLTNIIGFADLLKTPDFGELNDRQSEYLDHISTSSSVLLTIVNDILDLATVDAGIMKLDLASVELEPLLIGVKRHTEERLRDSQTELVVDISAAPAFVFCDGQRLKQILFKLLANAVQHAPTGSQITLRISKEGDNVAFSVTDEGPGIPKEALASVFDRFKTHDHPGQRGGAGLGLSIVESFVSLHHGTVSIDSVQGTGTTVTCLIPDQHSQSIAAAE